MSRRKTVNFTRLAAVQPTASERYGEVAENLIGLGGEVIFAN